MIRYIETNYGNFGDFETVEKFMRLEKKDEVDILKIHLWTGSVIEKVFGNISYRNIQQILGDVEI